MPNKNILNDANAALVAKLLARQNKQICERNVDKHDWIIRDDLYYYFQSTESLIESIGHFLKVTSSKQTNNTFGITKGNAR